MAADQALLADIEERKRLYTFKYHDLPENNQSASTSTITSEPASRPAISQQKPKPPPKRRQSSVDDKGSKKAKVTIKTPKPATSQKASSNKYTNVKVTPVPATEKPKASVFDDPFAFDEPGKFYAVVFN